MARFDKHTALWTAGVAGATAGFLLLVARPQFKRMAEARAELEAETTQFAAGSCTRQVIPQLERELEQLSRRIADFDARVPHDEQLGVFVEAVARSAQEHRLRADTIEPGQPVTSQGVSALPIRLKVRGPFTDVYAFLRDLEHLPRLTQVERFKVAVEEGQPGSVLAELQFRIFFRAS